MKNAFVNNVETLEKVLLGIRPLLAEIHVIESRLIKSNLVEQLLQVTQSRGILMIYRRQKFDLEKTNYPEPKKLQQKNKKLAD